MNDFLVIFALIGVVTVIKWVFKIIYWCFIVERSGNTGRYKHWEDTDERGR